MDLHLAYVHSLCSWCCYLCRWWELVKIMYWKILFSLLELHSSYIEGSCQNFGIGICPVVHNDILSVNLIVMAWILRKFVFSNVCEWNHVSFGYFIDMGLMTFMITTEITTGGMVINDVSVLRDWTFKNRILKATPVQLLRPVIMNTHIFIKFMLADMRYNF